METAYHFGTACSVTVFEAGRSEAVRAVFDRFSRIERRMSRGAADSEVARINRMAGLEPVRVSGDTYAVIAQGLRFSRLTEGRFDITVGPLVALWDIGGEGQRIPAAPEIREALELVDYRRVRLSPASREVFLPVSGMAIDLGGIAKGYAADEAGRLLRRRGVDRAIVDVGGNIVAIGAKGAGRPWRIGVQDPFEPRGAYCGVIEMADATAVTSGVYERSFEQGGRRYHHILDTATGYPVDGPLASVTIVARDAAGSPTTDSLAADALATGVFSMGPEDGARLVSGLPGVEAVFVYGDGRVTVTGGLSDRFTLTASGFSLFPSP